MSTCAPLDNTLLDPDAALTTLTNGDRPVSASYGITVTRSLRINLDVHHNVGLGTLIKPPNAAKTTSLRRTVNVNVQTPVIPIPGLHANPLALPDRPTTQLPSSAKLSAPTDSLTKRDGKAMGSAVRLPKPPATPDVVLLH